MALRHGETPTTKYSIDKWDQDLTTRLRSHDRHLQQHLLIGSLDRLEADDKLTVIEALHAELEAQDASQAVT